jgi:predicted O-linked N-acetylglucosamine transferase (SPINDLY family)
MPTTPELEQVFNKAIRYSQQGRFEDASKAWSRAAKLSPERPDIQYNLANVLKNLGRNDDAIKAYRRCIEIEPGLTNAHFNLGELLKSLNRLVEAAAAYRGAISSDHNDSEAHANLGNILDLLGDIEGAENSLNDSITLNPNSHIAHFNLGNILKKTSRSDEAITHYRLALAVSPNLLNAHIGLAQILVDQGNLNESIYHYAKAIELDPNNATNHSNLADVYRRAKHLSEGEESCMRALELDPEFAEAHCVLGSVFLAQGRIQDAKISFCEAITLKKGFFQAHCNLGNALKDLRDLEGALKAYETAMQLNQEYGTEKWGDALRNFLLILLYLPRLSNDQLFKHYCSNIKSTREKLPSAKLDKKNKRIRVGFVSSDFRSHPVGDNITPLFANHNNKRFEIFCYAQVVVKDHITKEFQKYTDHWHIINNLTDSEVAEIMRADGIDIAIFLGGHFDENRPNIANYRAAPIQVAMHGGTTTGLSNMNYWLSDNVLHPKEERKECEKFTETIWRLPNFYNFKIPNKSPEVSALPANKNGYVTFVSFNRLCKINNDVLDLWCSVLNAIPGSKLILKYRNHLGDASLAETVQKQFYANGVGKNLIELSNSEDEFNEHLTYYHQGDIALDTFPFSGATTTFQALWMGLPVVSLSGKRFISRMGDSISKHAGLGDFCASTPEEYIKICASLAKNLEYLSELRRNLRAQVAKSALCNGVLYARNFETALTAMLKEKYTND